MKKKPQKGKDTDLTHVFKAGHHQKLRSRVMVGARARNAAPGRPHRVDRIRELRQPARARGAGFGAHQQIRRRLSRQALLRRLRVRRHRRAARDRPCQETVQCRVRERAAAFRIAGQFRGVYGDAQARRHYPRHVARARRPPDARRVGQARAARFTMQSVTGSIRRRRQSTTTRSSAWRASTSRR